MAEDWSEVVGEVTRRALEIMNDPGAAVTRADSSAGLGSGERGLAFGIVAAVLEYTGNVDVELAEPDDESAEMKALRKENEALRQELAGPFGADTPVPDTAPHPDDVEGDDEEADPADPGSGVAYEDLTPAQKRARTMAEKAANGN